MVRTRLELEHKCIAWLRTFSLLGLKVNGRFVAHSGFWLEGAIATGSIILLYGTAMKAIDPVVGQNLTAIGPIPILLRCNLGLGWVAIYSHWGQHLARQMVNIS
jgi:hypothetical protein